MGLLDVISGGLTAGTNAAAAQQGAEVKGNQLLRAILMQQAQMNHLNAQIEKERADTAYTRHKNLAPVLGEDGYADAEGQVAGAKARAEQQPRIDTAVGIAQGEQPIKVATAVQTKKAVAPIEQETHRKNRAFDVANPTPTVKVVIDPNGQARYGTINPATGDVKETNARAPIPGGARGAVAMTQLETAAGQADEADRIMRAYEDKVLAHNASFSTVDAMLGKEMMKGSVLAERTLNGKNPELAQYLRGAKTVSSAERLITPRGGSNALMAAETMLAGAGAGANDQLINQARSYRSRLINGLRSHTTQGGQTETASPSAGSESAGRTVTVNGKTFTLPH